MTRAMLGVVEIDISATQMIVIRRIVSVEIESSWQMLTDTAEVKVPAKWLISGKTVDLRTIIKKEMPVRIYLGYADVGVTLRFQGLVSGVMSGVPVTIKCEDMMRKLKHTPVNVSYKSISLEAFLQKHLPKGIKYNVPQVELGTVKFIKMNMATCLEEIKKVYGLVAYFKTSPFIPSLKKGGESVLYVGRIYTHPPENKVKYVVHGMPKKEALLKKSETELKDKEDYKVQVTITNWLRNGKKVTATIGDKDGELITATQMRVEEYNTQAKLKTYLEANIDKYKKTGLQGTITAFGSPVLGHSDIISLRNVKQAAENGTFRIEKVSTKFSASGFEQIAKLGIVVIVN